MQLKAITTVALLAIGSPALAVGPNHNYAEFAYQNVDVDGAGSVDGFDVRGSFAINENFHIIGEVERLDDGPVSLTTLIVAAGYNLILTENTDLVARVGLVRADLDFGFGSADDNGYTVQAGVRSMLNDSFELNGFLKHVDAGGSDTELEVGAVYRFTNNFGVTGGVGFSDDATTIRIGGRFSF